MQTFRLFVSSPGDVIVESRRVENVVSRLNGEFAGVARLDAIRWETEFYQAYSTFQAQIPHSTDCDLGNRHLEVAVGNGTAAGLC